LRREREQLVVQQRNLRTRELAALRVLDERGQVDCSMGAHGESAQTWMMMSTMIAAVGLAVTLSRL